MLPLILANTQEREGEPLKAGTVMLPYLATSLLRLRDPALSKVRSSSFGRAQSLGTCEGFSAYIFLFSFPRPQFRHGTSQWISVNSCRILSYRMHQTNKKL